MKRYNPVIITLLIEFIFIFILLPVLVWKNWIPTTWALVLIYVVAGFSLWWLVVKKSMSLKQIWIGESTRLDYNFKKVFILRFIFVVTACSLLVYLYYPDKLFDFPLQHTMIWILLLVLYPVISVLPQEVLYRTFFFNRYEKLFKSSFIMILVCALAFMFMHLVFKNYIVLLATFIGGYFFADTFFRTRSLKLVLIEHCLYGYVVFTIGLGEFFLLEFSRPIFT